MKVYVLEDLKVDMNFIRAVVEDYEIFGDRGLPEDLEDYVLNKYMVDISSEFAGIRVRNPFGKASGQLSTNLRQIEEDVKSKLGFAVLKTVIAENECGESTMKDWKRPNPRMLVERIMSESGREGWNVVWRGKGWHGSFEDYLEFYKKAYIIGDDNDFPIAVSCQFHLPDVGEDFNLSEYEFTINRFLEAYADVKRRLPFILEIDFSPTLNSLTGARHEENVLRWFREVPRIVRGFLGKDAILGVKPFNTVLGIEFQKKILRELLSSDKIDYLTCCNRLFSVGKGIAYGGYDLSDVNLEVLSSLENDIRCARERGITVSATGNICSGKLMVEYALRGATTGQCHTFFQLPLKEYRMKVGRRSERALHELLFNPKEGLLISMKWLEENGLLHRDNNGLLKFSDIFQHCFRKGTKTC